MKKLALLGLFAVVASAAFGQTSDNKTVNLNIAKYVSISFDNGADINIDVNDGGQIGSYNGSANFTVLANCAYTVVSGLTGTGGPATWSSAITAGATGGAPGAGGTVTVTASGLNLSNATVGTSSRTVTVTVTAD